MNEHMLTRGDKTSALLGASYCYEGSNAKSYQLLRRFEAIVMQDHLGGRSAVESGLECAFDMKEEWDVQAPS